MNTLYVYSTETMTYVDIICGADNAECENIAEERWGSNDHAWTYSPGLPTPSIGDTVIEV